jgi:serine phosphatase RsbU (regulator of sigma subunit)
VIIDGTDPTAAAQQIARLRPTGELCMPILWIGPVADGLAAGADAALAPPVEPEVLVRQVQALVRMQVARERLAQRAAEAAHHNQRLQQLYRQMDRDVELARRLQRNLLPRVLPDVGQIRFAVCHRPRSRVGGDFYDVMRLDEDHIAFYLADALTGEATASGLLTVYLRRSIQAKEIVGRSYRLVPPGEVLLRLHRELAALGLTDQPHLTVTYGLINCRDGLLSLARAAAPPPVYVPREGPPEVWPEAGPFLGVLEGDYTGRTTQLYPGDKLVLATDGLHSAEEPCLDIARLVATAVEPHRRRPVQQFTDAVSRDLLARTRQPDDFTLLTLECLEA